MSTKFRKEQVKNQAVIDGELLVLDFEGNLSILKEGEFEVIEKNVWFFTHFADGILYQYENGGDLVYLEGLEKKTIVSGNYYLDTAINAMDEIGVFEGEEDLKYKIINSALESKIVDSSQYGYLVEGKVFKVNDGILKYANVLNRDQEYEINFQSHLHLGEKCQGDLFGSKQFVFSETSNERLLSFDCKENKVVWIYEGPATGWDIADHYLYGTNGSYIVEVDMLTGEETKRLDFNDFSSVGITWAFKNVIVCSDYFHKPSRIAIIDRSSLKIISQFESNAKVLGYRDKIVELDNEVFVIDMNNILESYHYPSDGI